jgi:hypothetical protein
VLFERQVDMEVWFRDDAIAAEAFGSHDDDRWFKCGDYDADPMCWENVLRANKDVWPSLLTRSDMAPLVPTGCVCPVEWGDAFRRPQRATVPLSEADWVAVERLLAGDRSVPACASERDAAIDRLDGLGLSQRQIAIRLGVTMRTVARRRAARRLDGAS